MANPSGSKGKDEGRTGTGQQRMKEAGDTASQALDKARQAATSAVSRASQKAEDATSAAGSGLRNLGESIRENTPREGVFGSASQAVGDTLRQGGRYLEQEGLRGAMDDALQLVRDYPIPAVMVGVAVGYLMGCVLKS